MNNRIHIILFFLTLPMWGSAQSNFQYLDYHVDTNQSIIFGLRTDVFSNSNTLSAVVANSALYGGYITREDRQEMLNRAGEYNNTGTWLNTSFYFAKRVDTLFGKKRIGLSLFASIADRQENNALFSENALALVLFGNQQFLGSGVELAPLNFNQYHYQKFQIGFNKNYKSGINICLGLSYLYGQTNRRGITEKLGLMGTSLGEQFIIDAEILVQQTDPNNTHFMAYNGSGVSLDFQTEIPIQLLSDTTKPGFFTFTIADAGFIFWNGTSREYMVDSLFEYNGIHIENIFDPSSSTTGLNSGELFDSVVIEKNIAHTTTLPVTVQFQLSQQFNKTTIDLGAILRFKAYYRTFFYGKVGYQINNTWNVLCQLNYGGYGDLGGGLGINYTTKKMEIELGSSNIEGFIAPTKVAGQNLYILLKMKL